MKVERLAPDDAAAAAPDLADVLLDAVADGVSADFLADLTREQALDWWTAALAGGRWLLQLDTQTGTLAERLYEHWGWQRIGVLADHAAAPDGTLTATTFFAKDLRADLASPA